MNSALKIKNLNFSYSTESVLCNINLDISESETLILLGPNGSGKSTLLKCMLGILPFSEGNIECFGKALQQYSRSELSKKICFVPQLSAINTGFLARDYIALASTPYLKFYESPSKVVYQKIDEYATEFNASNLLNRSMLELSGGEQQIVSIIKALVQDSPIIVLDEPTSALDYGNQGRFLEYVKKLQSLNKTIIMSSHNPNHALLLNCNICVLKNKTISYYGNANDIINEQMLTEVYGGAYEIVQCANGLKNSIWK